MPPVGRRTTQSDSGRPRLLARVCHLLSRAPRCDNQRPGFCSGGSEMRKNPPIPLGAAVLCCLSVFAVPLVGHAQNGLGNGGDPRPRRSGRPAPRTVDGRALLGSTAEEEGVWLPGNPFIPNALGMPAEADLPVQ